MRIANSSVYPMRLWHPRTFVSTDGRPLPFPIASLNAGFLQARAQSRAAALLLFECNLLFRSWNSGGGWLGNARRRADHPRRHGPPLHVRIPQSLQQAAYFSHQMFYSLHSVAHTLSKFHPHIVTLTSQISPQLTSYDFCSHFVSA